MILFKYFKNVFKIQKLIFSSGCLRKSVLMCIEIKYRKITIVYRFNEFLLHTICIYCYNNFFALIDRFNKPATA